MEYDTYGRPETVKATAGGNIHGVKQVTYDDNGRPICTALRLNPSEFNSLPSSACTLGTAGAFGPDRINRTWYNTASQVTASTAGYGTDVARSEYLYYHADGTTKYLRDGNDNYTYYKYDGFNRQYLKYFPKASDGSVNLYDFEQTHFDTYGRTYKKTLRDGSLVFNTFDDLGRTTLVDTPGTADDVSFTYDNFGRTLTTTKNSATVTNTYDALSRRLTEVTSNGTVSYEYDVAGRGTKITYPGSGLYVNYDYDTVGNVTDIRENGATSGIGVLASYAYDDQHRRTSITRGNGVTSDYTFDVLSRLTSLENDPTGTVDDQTLTFTHMASSQIATRHNDNSAYDWDGAGILSESFSVNGLNQVISAAIGTIGYDARGNTTSAGSKTYTYDIFNQLTGVNGSGTNATMTYDPVGRMAQVTGSSVTTKFVYSGSQMIAETNSSGTTLRRYVHGPGMDEPVVWYEGTGTATRKWFMVDNLGSVTGITDASGTVTNKNTYSEYGVPATGNTGRFQYTGQVWLAEAQIYHYKARAYDPYLGRFLQTDPIGYGDGLNMYGYVAGDPVNYVDPTGMRWCYGRVTSGGYSGAFGHGDEIIRHGTRGSVYCHDDRNYDDWDAYENYDREIDDGGENCTPTQIKASNFLKKNNGASIKKNREHANAIFSVNGSSLQLAPITAIGKECGSLGCTGPDVSFIVNQIPHGATIHAYMHTHGAQVPSYLSVQDVVIGEPSAYGNPFHSITPGAIQSFDTSQYEGNFFIDKSGIVQQYVPGTLPGGTPLTAVAAAASKPIKC